jgi:AAA15 family ATPase/GTPase
VGSNLLGESGWPRDNRATAGDQDAEGYRMIESLTIRNFRCFEDIAIKDIGRINIIVGRNASGKTAMLEALYSTLGTPALTLKIRGWRGLAGPMLITDRNESMNAVWRDYFYRFEQNRTATIAFRGSQDMNRTLTIRCQTESSTKISTSKRSRDAEISEYGGYSGVEPAGQIEFRWYKNDRQIAISKPELVGESIRILGGPPPLPGAFFSSTGIVNQQESAIWFSELSKRREAQPIIDAIQALFPFVTGLSVETQGTMPMVHADIESLPEKIPAGLISSGVNKLIYILCAIATQKQGILLIDEIENGFHFKTMPGVWQAIYDACKKYHVQLFASTHSQECLESLTDVIRSKEQDFSLLRTVRGESNCQVRHFTGSQFLGGLEEDIELRS